MLTIYRRHLATCPHKGTGKNKGRLFTRCHCPWWIQGTHEGVPSRKSLDVTSRVRAEELKLEISTGRKAVEEKPAITVSHATEKYFKACEARQLAAKTLSKYQTLTEKIKDFADDNGIKELGDFDQQAVRDFLATRGLSPLTAGKEIERVRTFFTFCQQNDWIEKNPAKFIKPPKSKQLPRLPFSDTDVANLLSLTKNDTELAFILTLRHTGLRIGDAALLRTGHFSENRIYLRTTKAGTPVSVVIPPQLITLLKALPSPGGYFFLLGESTHPHTTSDLWRKRIKRMCKDAKISPDHPHRFRHTLAADLLMKGASVEDVAAILGNSPGVVVKHYSQWVRGRQDRLDAIVEKTWQSGTKLVLVDKQA